jgi:hypothetical protein
VFGPRIQFDGRGAPVFMTMLAVCYGYAFAVYLLFEQNPKRARRGFRQFRVI